ncbi:hypothetical protein [Seonamhaeicola sp.]|uniref:hypothetical protein n=1 Tax=Seonamhaeicola sp. TaxID=1912245 RepID=UPI0026238E73|nr:hypothetical protein [Seonamhaeicola sp.]
MDNQTDKYLDDLTKKVINQTTVESPSVGFTSSVMSQIAELKSATTTYKPLITKWGWLLILMMSLVLVAYILFTSNPTGSSSFLNALDFSVLYENKLFDTVSNFPVSKTVVYAVVLFGLMFSIQIPFLKSHFNKQYE